jgi:hypothetical protein
MKKTLTLIALILILSACGSKQDSELIKGTWEEYEFIYLSDLKPVLPHDEFGYDGSVKTFDGQNVSIYGIWYGTPSETNIYGYTIDENSKTLNIKMDDSETKYDYEFPDENTLVLYLTVDNKKRKISYTRKLS